MFVRFPQTYHVSWTFSHFFAFSALLFRENKEFLNYFSRGCEFTERRNARKKEGRKNIVS